MWKILKFIGLLFKTVFWLSLIVALVGLVGLYILERDIPEPLVKRAEELASSGDYLCRIGRATYSLRSGLHLHHVKVFPKRVAEAALASVDEISVDIDIRPRVKLSDRLRSVTLRNVSFPALPPKPRQAAAVPGQPPPRPPESSSAPHPFHLPSIAAFPLVVEQANVLGLQAERITATIALQDPVLSVTQVAILWPDKAPPMTVTGFVTVDFGARMVKGNAKGQAFPQNILPLLSALKAKGAIKQVNCFSKIARPVNADATFDVNMDNSDFALILDLDVGPCAYHDVPMKFAKGTLRAYGTNIFTTVDVGPIQAESDTGPLSGRLIYREDSESLELDADTAVSLDELVQVINILNHGELSPLRCDTPPRIQARGIMAIDSKKSTVTNSLSGKIAFDRGAIFKLAVHNVTADLSINGYSALIDNVEALSSSGGPLAGNVIFTFPGYSATATVFTARAKLSDVDLADLSRVFNVTNARAGMVSGSLLVHGRASDHTLPTLSGEGSLAIKNGLLHRMPLFAGFTDYLASNIPGVSALVNQSSASMDFKILNGFLSTENLLIEGDLFSMNGKGSCNLSTEALDFLIRANIFKEKTFAGKITRLVTLPFTRLLLEFKVFGTLDKTDWSYVSIIERITDSLTELSGSRKKETAPPEPAQAHPQSP